MATVSRVERADQPKVLQNHRRLSVVIPALACASVTLLPVSARAGCEFLMPLGGKGNGPQPWIVKKRVERPKGLLGRAVGRTNWNTDFVVNRPYRSYKLFFTADSSDGQPRGLPDRSFPEIQRRKQSQGRQSVDAAADRNRRAVRSVSTGGTEGRESGELPRGSQQGPRGHWVQLQDLRSGM